MRPTTRSIASLVTTGALGVLAVVACAGPVNFAGDASTEGGPKVFGPFIDGPALEASPIPCGDARCNEPARSGPLGEVACCLPSGECGLRSSVLESGCSPKHAAGGADLHCAGRSFPGGPTLQGCCAPGGRCGLIDPESDLGCVAAPNDAGACDYEAASDCTRIVEIPCDGPEDCGTGNVCCGRSQPGGYDRFGCYPSCPGVVDGQSGVWLEICHPGQPCQDSQLTCEPSDLLPPPLARCHLPGPPSAPDAGDASARDASVEPDASLESGASADSGGPDGSGAAEGPHHRSPRPIAPLAAFDEPFVEQGIACGGARCSASEKCCLRRHAAPTASMDGSATDSYCEKKSTPCACSSPVDR